ncbi:hypothetical protein GE09DRAFT_619913 [Coniochaeta sp. 2T2.1]|nr:hypothetical protein GE09DRAFT_619913 [Coniochaeta sp. 2T2.1]
MPEELGPIKRPKRKSPPRPKCNNCLDLQFPPNNEYGLGTKTVTAPWGEANRLVSVRNTIKSMKRGCQICFAILKGADDILMPLVTQSPPPPGALSSGPRKFPFLDYMPGNVSKHNVFGLRERAQLPLQIHVAFSIFRGDIDENKTGYIKVTNVCDDQIDFPIYCEVEFDFELFSDCSAPPVPFRGIFTARRVPARLTSKRRQRLVKAWMDDCTKNHPQCCWPLLALEDDGASNAWRPKRLLDLGDNPRNRIRLVSGEELGPESGPYATVSHVSRPRGDSATVLNQWCKLQEGGEIRWRDLPPVFQDAVVIASEQRIRYLWIHALCVRQDDESDVDLHIGEAHRIYGHSYLNIAIERSSNLQETCLGTRWVDESRGTEVFDSEISVFKDGKPYKVYARPSVHHPETPFISHLDPARFPYRLPRWQSYVSPCPLLDSANFVQEQLISPRTLHIDRTEIAWECRVKTGCECQPSTANISVDYGSEIAMLRLTLARNLPSPCYSSPVQFWEGLRGLYIHKVSKVPDDRLSPLIGLATCLQPVLNRTFIAGLFAKTKEDIARELMWYIGASSAFGLYEKKVKLGSRRVTSRLYQPTWSWTSIVTQHPYPVRSVETMFDFYGGSFVRHEDFQCHGYTNDKLRHREPADNLDEPHLHAHIWKLKLSGKLITGKIATLPHNTLYPSRGIYKFIAANTPDLASQLPQTTSTRHRKPDAPLVKHLPPPSEAKWNFPAGDVMMDCDEFDRERKGSAAAVLMGYTWAYFLLLGRVKRSHLGEKPDGADVHVGLALQRARDGKTGGFERVGVFWLASGEAGGLFDEGQVQDVVLV